MLRLLEWSQEGHRYVAEVRDVDGRRVWFVGVDDDLPRAALELSAADENEDALRARLVRAVRRTDLE